MFCALWRRLNTPLLKRMRNGKQRKQLQRRGMERYVLERNTNATYISRVRQRRYANKNLHTHLRRRQLRRMGNLHGTNLPGGKQTYSK